MNISSKLPLFICLLSPSFALAQTIKIDFGNASTSTNIAETWNNITSTTTGVTDFDLLETTGDSSGITLSITGAFTGVNSSGTQDSSAPVPTSASRDSFYVQNTTGTINFEGLDPHLSYSFTFYASRVNSTPLTDNREGAYTLIGADTVTVYLNAANNITVTESIPGIRPTAGGLITFNLTEGPNNTNTNNWAYIGAMELTAVPESSTYGVLLGAACILCWGILSPTSIDACRM
jgi:hypothetical protein